MTDIETLTEEERELAEEAISDVETSERVLTEGTDVGRPELAAALRKMQRAYTALVVLRSDQSIALARARKRIEELSAQVLAADTVSKVEYQAMVEQRDTLRQERNAARERASEMRTALSSIVEQLRAWRDDSPDEPDADLVRQEFDDMLFEAETALREG